MEQRSDAPAPARAGPSKPAGTHGPVCPTSSATATLHPLGLGEVVLEEGSVLGDWQLRNSTSTIPHCIGELTRSGALRNLEQVAGGHAGEEPHHGLHFSDSDVYKTLEACAWDSFRGLSTEIEGFVERSSLLVAHAQRDDGYVDTWFQGQHPELVWKDLRWGHELYCAGHLLQAAVADGRTGGAALQTVAKKLLEHLLATFSLEDGDGRLVGVCGHPEIETALVEYYRYSGDVRALRLAKRYIELRGQPGVPLPAAGVPGDRRFPLSYFLHHLPVRERTVATGHAVRELYLQAGVVDVAVETNDDHLLAASEAIWEDLYRTKTYVTGSHGSRHRDESIGDAYELPSDRAYAETCAAIASFHWNWRLLLATGRARYAEAMEQVFWNTIAGAVSRNGTEFFYSNTLHLRTGHDAGDEDSPGHRLRWYECPCCPPNLARLMASMQAFLVTRDSSGLQLHMPFSGKVSTLVPAGGAIAVDLRIKSGHPWAGTTEIEVTGCNSAASWQLSVRRPEWAGNRRQRATLNGQPLETSPETSLGTSLESLTGPYLTIDRPWSPGDVVRIDDDMPIRVLRPHWRADAIRGCRAVQRGPLVYCLEAEDLDGEAVIEDVALDTSKPLRLAQNVPEGLEDYVNVAVLASGYRLGDAPVGSLDYEAALESEGEAEGAQAGLGDGAAPESSQATPEVAQLTFVPYFARSNRSLPAMRVWVPAPAPAPEHEHEHEYEHGRERGHGRELAAAPPATSQGGDAPAMATGATGERSANRPGNRSASAEPS
ncbi:MAG TPA: beta-L-arabinofuranosidase domain-containing protein [Acidimicrobiales bacterium]|nr:beta-L-arabinofuranosidase domain-containing protein [Acidimicrobiales bacterium]